MGKVPLHLIKGPPATHPDSNLIASHIALEVTDMAKLRSHLSSMGVEIRRNVTVLNSSTDVQLLDQVVSIYRCCS